MFCTALDSWRVEFTARHRAVSAIATTNAVRYVKKLRPSPAFCADVCRVCVSTSTWRTFRRACAMGLEGIVSKRNGPYVCITYCTSGVCSVSRRPTPHQRS